MNKVYKIAKNAVIEVLAMSWVCSFPAVIMLGGLYAIYLKPLWIMIAILVFLPFRISDIKKETGWRKWIPVMIHAGLVIFMAGCITSMMFMYKPMFFFTLAAGAAIGFILAIPDLLYWDQKLKQKILEWISDLKHFVQ
ncbi:MAG: hypothetical protein KDK41_13175 [Leptospiraceae bacterium]|nr:hypothetical protein [Leptospiraceae bacterium]